ncbi:DUF2807 domain-containing protein [Hyunsoonleella sp. SJ7]|uniref:DUF2807 domain-containing protein n=1 Tax=Hyunsoonleella aquatilis TaxID=2762758 RepID=A0A923KLK0_9FLAO|nr:head GIN domain-containing protein [Hyunsoonleella aquatilis]MBC3758000.1 DUF2807 domain-containing protein [Hyunsoonleella aquatilis]
MLKRIACISLILLVFACDSENANDCFQTAGPLVQKELIVESFDKILVNRDVELILKDGAEQKVVVETGENLLNDVEVSVINGRITLTDNNNCNYVRDYGITKVYITSPNIREIRSSTQYSIKSDGVLTYPEINVLSEDFNTPGTFTVGDFILEVNSNTFRATFNGLSSCFVSGSVNNLNVSFFAGDGRFEGRNLIAQNVEVLNRGSNDMVVNPQAEITGTISSTGNVIAVNRPPVVEVEELYKGRLIFE